MDDIEQVPFLNNWNIDQTFLLEGQIDQQSVENLCEIIKLKNPSTKIIESNCSITECDESELIKL